jgi:hypothetical protein
VDKEISELARAGVKNGERKTALSALLTFKLAYDVIVYISL